MINYELLKLESRERMGQKNLIVEINQPTYVGLENEFFARRYTPSRALGQFRMLISNINDLNFNIFFYKKILIKKKSYFEHPGH